MPARRLNPDRFQRIWALVERIDREPGLDRRQLADEFALSERQLQADLLLVRNEMGLPLERSHGYRFANRVREDGEPGLADVVVLARLARSAEAGADGDRGLAALLPRLVSAFPPRLQPFARAVLTPSSSDGAHHAPEMLVALAEAMLGHHTARVRLASNGTAPSYRELTVDPQLLIPFASSWYLVGYCHERQRDVMVQVDELDPSFVEVLDFVRV